MKLLTSQKKLFSFLLVAILLALSSYAQAGVIDTFMGIFDGSYVSGSKAEEVLKEGGDATGFIEGKISSIININVLDVGRDIANGSGVIGNAKNLLNALMLIYVLTVLLTSMFKKGMQFGSEMLNMFLTYAVFMMMLVFYDTIFSTGVVGIFDSISSSMSLFGGGDVKTVMTNSIMDLLMTALGIFTKIAQNFASFNPFAWVEAILVTLPIAYAAYLVAKAAIQIFIYFIMGDFLAAVALAIGPFMIAFGILPWTREWMFSWVKFFFSALAFKVIAILVISIASKTVMGLLNPDVLAGNSYSGGAILADSLMTILLASALIQMIDMIPGIAANLFNGGSGMSGSTSATNVIKGSAGSLRGGSSKPSPSKPAPAPTPTPAPPKP